MHGIVLCEVKNRQKNARKLSRKISLFNGRVQRSLFPYLNQWLTTHLRLIVPPHILIFLSDYLANHKRS